MSIKTSDFAKEYLKKRGYSTVSQVKKEVTGTNDFSVNWKHESILRLISEETASDDPIEIIRMRSRELVLKAFNMGWSGPPFNVEELATLLDYKVVPNELLNEARIIPVGNTFIIEYNPFQSPARTNFSLAHEVAHTLFSDCSETIRYRKNELEKGSWELEFLCNIGASELLLPYAEFTGTANKIQPTIDNLISLAREYRASVESVFLRFCDVIDYPCTIVICSFNEASQLVVNYSKNSRKSNLLLNKGDIIPKYSKAYECIRPGWTAYENESWDAFDHLSLHVGCVGISAIRKQLITRVAILITPIERVNHMNNGIYLVSGDATEPRGNNKNIIVQIVNTSAGVGFGFGRALAKKYPATRDSLKNWKKDKSLFSLGNTNLIRINFETSVFQILAQDGLYPKKGSIPLKYSSLRKGLIKLREFALQNSEYSIHMPAIGSGQAGGDWNIIKGMIYDEIASFGIEVTIYFLPSKTPINKNQPLILKDVNEK